MEEEIMILREEEVKTRKKKKEMEVDSRELQRRRRRMLCDVDAEREVEKVDLEQECRRNVRNGGVFLWLETETEGGQKILSCSCRALHVHSGRSCFLMRYTDVLQIKICLIIFLNLSYRLWES